MAKLIMSIMFFSMSVVLLSAIGKTSAVNYTFTNAAQKTPGGVRYDNDIGRDYSLQILQASSNFIWNNIFQQQPHERKNTVRRVSLLVDDKDGVYTIDDQIHVSARYIQGYLGDLRAEITGLLYHEMTHILQWTGNGKAPIGLIEGMADYVRLKAGFAPSNWVKPGQGDRWDQGYDVTARFLDYCNDRFGNGNFVAELNRMMRDRYSDSFFEELLGKNVYDLWSDYKARYGYN